MSAFWPAPSMIVVFSFSMRTRLARPSIGSCTVSSLMPRSSEIVWPAVRTAMSSSMALRRSPKPGALTAATLRPPGSLLTTRGAGGPPSASSATIRSGLPPRTPRSGNGGIASGRNSFFLEDWQHRLERRQLLLVDEDVGVLELGDHLLRIGDEIRGQVAAVELHALDHVELGLGGLGLLDGDDALVTDLLHRIGDHLANRG